MAEVSPKDIMKIFKPSGDVSPNTNKGDITVFSTTNARLPVGSNTQVLTADSSQAQGVKWAAVPSSPTQSAQLNNVGLSASVGSNKLTIALKQSDGSTDPSAGSPVQIGFRDATATNGDYNIRSVTASLSMDVVDGASLGSSSVNNLIYVYAIDNAGTVELAVSLNLFDEGVLQTTTAMDSSSDFSYILYSTTARSSVPIRLIGRIKCFVGGSAHWTNAPTEIALTPFGQKTFVYAQSSITASWSSNSTLNSYAWRRFDHLFIRGNIVFTGAPNNTSLIINLPTSLFIDYNKMVIGNLIGKDTPVGTGIGRKNGANTFLLFLRFSGATGSVDVMAQTAGSTYINYISMSPTLPFTFGVTDSITFEFEVPISGWDC